MSQKNDRLVVGLDIGTTKICTVVGEMEEGGTMDVIGIGLHPSNGLRKGVVVNIDATVASIRKAVEEAELMAGCEINEVYAGIAGGHIRSLNSQGIVAVKDRLVKETDVTRVIDAARAIALPMDREVIHIVPQEFIVDDQDGVREPVGMSGVRLEAKVHIVTAAVTSAQNIVKSCNRSGLHVNDIVLEPIASSEAVLSDEEKELGVALVDIGGGTTDVAIYLEGALQHTAVISLGGDHLTNDIAVGLRTPLAAAEEIKRRHGCVLHELVEPSETIEVPSVGGRAPRILKRGVICDILEPRVEEIFSLVKRELEGRMPLDMLAGGVVLTGGSTILEGMPQLGETLFGLPVRRGAPQGVGGLSDVVNNPIYSTGVGLALYGMRNQRPRYFRIRENNLFGKVRERMKDWMRDFF